MAHYSFKEDLTDAEKTERELGQILEKQKFEILDVNHTNEYDIKAQKNGQIFKFEAKHDLMAPQTGNTVVEFECRGRPSGIQTTKADMYCYKIGKHFYAIAVVDLRKFIDAKEYKMIVNGGDAESNTKMYLFDAEKLLTKFIVLS